MDYSAVSQAAKRFEQKSKDNHKIGEIKQKMMAAFFIHLLSFRKNNSEERNPDKAKISETLFCSESLKVFLGEID